MEGRDYIVGLCPVPGREPEMTNGEQTAGKTGAGEGNRTLVVSLGSRSKNGSVMRV